MKRLGSVFNRNSLNNCQPHLYKNGLILQSKQKSDYDFLKLAAKNSKGERCHHDKKCVLLYIISELQLNPYFLVLPLETPVRYFWGFDSNEETSAHRDNVVVKEYIVG